MPRARRNKKSELAPKMLPGQVMARMVRCGKRGCKCARGRLHGPYFYHRTFADGRHSKAYIRRADVAQVRAACDAYRALQRELRAGRAQYARTLAQMRTLLRGLGL